MATDGPITLRIQGSDERGYNYRIELDGRDISAKVTGITLEMHAGDVNRALISYVVDRVEVDGVFKITQEATA